MYPKDPSNFSGDVFSEILSERPAILPLNLNQNTKMPNMFYKKLHDMLEQQQPVAMGTVDQLKNHIL